ncbi:MAG: hypothetical protein CVU03_02060 [Bacteroidetes bacterium HGW-Bacteroidetes-2]|jgi:hypothetical protein|nr:MAG: hypothetical protein CVU13_06255 [Bacteroidetes bacterium HGW-Bacteroidetes-8]PKP26681.1 MAG: hypothetical protein CVU03_02060 [Bacteroidetes bacterium HGW-Bacteroidetes-2]
MYIELQGLETARPSNYRQVPRFRANENGSFIILHERYKEASTSKKLLLDLENHFTQMGYKLSTNPILAVKFIII